MTERTQFSFDPTEFAGKRALEGLGRGTGARYQGGSGDPEVTRSTA